MSCWAPTLVILWYVPKIVPKLSFNSILTQSKVILFTLHRSMKRCTQKLTCLPWHSTTLASGLRPLSAHCILSSSDASDGSRTHFNILVLEVLTRNRAPQKHLISGCSFSFWDDPSFEALMHQHQPWWIVHQKIAYPGRQPPCIINCSRQHTVLFLGISLSPTKYLL